MSARGKDHSVETILTFNKDNDDNFSDYSTVWSTSQVAGMDTATGGGSRRRKTGRRRLRIASLAFCSMLTMHCHISAVSITSGYFILLLMLLPAMAVLGNPLRHFEVYLGEWSISGPGRAFRILPMFDGIGISICILALCRAIVGVVMAAITAIYVFHSISDNPLPFSYCRDFNLTVYNPKTILVDVMLSQSGSPFETLKSIREEHEEIKTTTVGMDDLGWRKAHFNYAKNKEYHETHLQSSRRTTRVCKETFSNKYYPPIYRTPAYNFFYVELMHYREDHSFGKINVPLVISIMIMWGIIWIFLIIEKMSYGRLIWNNMYPWFSGVPWVWSLFLLFTGLKIFFTKESEWLNTFEIGGKRELLPAITDALMVSIYIHAAGLGSEIIHGKGLNHYASGHIDPNLNGENIWHSCILLILIGVSSAGAEICALADSMHMSGINNVEESVMWVFPMYSKCALHAGSYQHSTSALIFAGLTFSYLNVTFGCLKSALHTIFEYNVKLVFKEQAVVGMIIVGCAGLSVLFATNGGLPLLEGVDALMNGVGMPLVCCLETLSLIIIYRSHDFMSDMNIATEENACSSRLGIQWQILPFICLILTLARVVLLCLEKMEIPSKFLWLASVPLLCLILAVPLHAVHNAIRYSNHPRRS